MGLNINRNEGRTDRHYGFTFRLSFKQLFIEWRGRWLFALIQLGAKGYSSNETPRLALVKLYRDKKRLNAFSLARAIAFWEYAHRKREIILANASLHPLTKTYGTKKTNQET